MFPAVSDRWPLPAAVVPLTCVSRGLRQVASGGRPANLCFPRSPTGGLRQRRPPADVNGDGRSSRLDGKGEDMSARWRRILLLIIAITVHNIPGKYCTVFQQVIIVTEPLPDLLSHTQILKFKEWFDTLFPSFEKDDTLRSHGTL